MRPVGRLVDGITVILLVAMCGATVTGVLDRFVLGVGLAWPEEVSRFLLIWVSLLAAAIAVRERKHFVVDVVGSLWGGPRLAARLDAVIRLVCFLFLLGVVGYGLQLSIVFHPQRSPALGLPMSVVYAAVPVSGALMLGYLARDAVRDRRGPRPSGD
ncbi:MAG: TRAP transporter small permease [candidate division NC10 bacterium]|nr:TRAP transporter small permease [candidate division NC10 bacterium]MBI2113890.1 TRAP transporter small permease [candidate division NC10 bacterium]MBI2163216.1 TRAP transporter small permease [candidate division NC10 bacterium]MBI2457368.1 TRAP transporter small permease [candidate division NC10 bacterium]MBI3085991.1 TRAP transporter small permease [candidate division NC10 bacterium]